MYEIFRSAAPQAVVEMSLERFSRYLSWALVSGSPSTVQTAKSYPVGANICRSLLANFQALGLFEPSGKTHLVGDDKEYWSLTPKGNAIYSAALIQEMEENALLSGAERDVFDEQEESVDPDTSE